MKEIRTVLTDEQFKKIKKMMPLKMGDKKPLKECDEEKIGFKIA